MSGTTPPAAGIPKWYGQHRRSRLGAEWTPRTVQDLYTRLGKLLKPPQAPQHALRTDAVRWREVDQPTPARVHRWRLSAVRARLRSRPRGVPAERVVTATPAVAALPSREPAWRPVVYLCLGGPPTHFYREIAPGRWETARDVGFTYPVRIEDQSRAEIEARGHLLLLLEGVRHV